MKEILNKIEIAMMTGNKERAVDLIAAAEGCLNAEEFIELTTVCAAEHDLHW